MINALSELLDDPNPQVRIHAAQELARRPEKKAVDILVAGLNDRNARVVCAVAMALADIGDARAVEPLLEVLKRADYGLQNMLGNALVRFGKMVIAPVLKLLDEPDENTRAEAVSILSSFHDCSVISCLLALLNDKDISVRRLAAYGLGNLQVNEAVLPLIPLLKDEDEDVRWVVAAALGKISDKQAVVPLVESLEDDFWPVREAALISLMQLGDNLATETIAKRLSDREENVRYWAAIALGNQLDKRGFELLVAALNFGDDSLIPVNAAFVLGKLGDLRALPHLLDLQELEEDVETWDGKSLLQTVARAIEQLRMK
ncbi:MAG TPA: HEAT repeat domain-containing protein [Chloroflexia bacterium]|nr:HEAT repeat domain-containing protein [Chloroflexia bacterium]